MTKKATKKVEAKPKKLTKAEADAKILSLEKDIAQIIYKHGAGISNGAVACESRADLCSRRHYECLDQSKKCDRTYSVAVAALVSVVLAVCSLVLHFINV